LQALGAAAPVEILSREPPTVPRGRPTSSRTSSSWCWKSRSCEGKTLAQRGEREAIEHIRRRFQQQMAEEFTSVVEQATGRKGQVFLSETNIDQDVSVETFLLADGGTDMTGFEDA
jgi:hypothetical protein